jgi:hypothetical protein
VALAIGFTLGFRYSIPFAGFAVIGATFAFLPTAVIFFLRVGQLYLRGEERPTRQLMRDAPRVFGFVTGCMLVTAQMAVLMWLKVMLPLAQPFWADVLFADLDRALFGMDAWRLTHKLGELNFLDTIYVTWAPVKTATFVAILLFPENAKKATALLAYFMTWAAGALGQYTGSSAGPVFYQKLGLGDRFADLPQHQWVDKAANYVWNDYVNSGGHIGTGISAMPSMHVAIAIWVALAVHSYFPKCAAIAWIWAAAILLGSVHLGWHYAVDGIVAVAGTVLCWAAAKLIITRKPSELALGMERTAGSLSAS